MDRPHATPLHADTGSTATPDLFRQIVLPAAGAVTLIVLFFTLLLSGPGQPESAQVDSTATATDPSTASASASNPAIGQPAPPCDVPRAIGEAGVVAARFSGKPTSSGHRYDPSESACITNAAGALGGLPYGSEVQLQRSDDPARAVVCNVVGRWNGKDHTDRIVLVSSALADVLAIGAQGLVEVESSCGPGTAPPVHASLR